MICSIQHYLVKLVSDLQQVCGFSPGITESGIKLQNHMLLMFFEFQINEFVLGFFRFAYQYYKGKKTSYKYRYYA
jgi:hypothetical protein